MNGWSAFRSVRVLCRARASDACVRASGASRVGVGVRLGDARTERAHAQSALASLVLKRRVERAAYDDDDDEVETRAGRCRR